MISRSPGLPARWALIVGVIATSFVAGLAAAGESRVGDAGSLREAVARARPGDRIVLEPGEYAGGFTFSGVRGEACKPIVIGGDRSGPAPLLRGGGTALQLTDCAHVVIEHLEIVGASGNGINIDDGGSFDTPARDVVIRSVRIKDIGPRGNNDGIKLSGVVDFRVEGCTIERWGVRGGSGIDMVGCHRGLIEGNVFRHQDEVSSSGVQAKGGSRDIVIRKNRFERAGGRAVNIGGSTGFEYFRPAIDVKAAAPGSLFEAKDIVVEGNVFVGSTTPLAFVGVDGARVRHNTIYMPGRWALRILQETQSPALVSSRNGEVTENLFVFRARGWGGAVNIGANTASETFRFARNCWFALDDPALSRPQLPTAEVNAIIGKDPRLVDPEKGDFRIRDGSPAGKAGAHVIDPALSPLWPLEQRTPSGERL